MGWIFPQTPGFAPADADNAYDPSRENPDCPARYYGRDCAQTIDVGATNALISEIACVIDSAGITPDCDILCNLFEALQALYETDAANGVTFDVVAGVKTFELGDEAVGVSTFTSNRHIDSNGQVLSIQTSDPAGHGGANSMIAGGSNNDMNGNNALASGNDNVISGTSGLTVGSSNNVVGSFSIVGGQSHQVAGSSNLVVGDTNDVAGNNNIVGGVTNIVSGARNLVVGVDNTCTANGSCGIIGRGNFVNASCNSTLVVGFDNIGVDGDSGLIVGSNNRISAGVNSAQVFGRFTENPDTLSACGGTGGGAPATSNRTWRIEHINGDFTTIGAYNTIGAFPGFGEYFLTSDALPEGRFAATDDAMYARLAEPDDEPIGITRRTLKMSAGGGIDPANAPHTYDRYGNETGRNPAYDMGKAGDGQSSNRRIGVEMLGRCHVDIDGTVTRGCWLRPGPAGVATKSLTRTKYRAMSIDDGTGAGDRVALVMIV